MLSWQNQQLSGFHAGPSCGRLASSRLSGWVEVPFFTDPASLFSGSRASAAPPASTPHPRGGHPACSTDGHCWGSHGPAEQMDRRPSLGSKWQDQGHKTPKPVSWLAKRQSFRGLWSEAGASLPLRWYPGGGGDLGASESLSA